MYNLTNNNDWRRDEILLLCESSTHHWSSSTHYNRSKLLVILWHSNFVNFMSLSVARLPIYLHPPPFIADYIKVCRYVSNTNKITRIRHTHTILPTHNSPLPFNRMLGSKPDAGLWLKLNGRDIQLPTTAQAEAVPDEYIVNVPSHRHCHHLIQRPRNLTRMTMPSRVETI